MGRQIQHFLHPEDQAMVEEYLTYHLLAVLLAERSPTIAPRRLAHADRPVVMICPGPLLPVLSPRELPGRQEWVLGAAHHPVIEWHRSRLVGETLYPGRFYYATDRLDPSSAEVLRSTGQRLFRWIRAAAPKTEVPWGQAHLGPVAARLLAEGVISVKANPV